MDPITLGVAALVVLVLLIAIRIPIAYAMILVGGVGIVMVNGLPILLSQMKTLGWGISRITVCPSFPCSS